MLLNRSYKAKNNRQCHRPYRSHRRAGYDGRWGSLGEMSYVKCITLAWEGQANLIGKTEMLLAISGSGGGGIAGITVGWGVVVTPSRKTQNICITFVQCWTNVFNVGPTLYKCYTNVLFFLWSCLRAGCSHWLVPTLWIQPIKHYTLTQRWVNVWPASNAVVQHYATVESILQPNIIPSLFPLWFGGYVISVCDGNWNYKLMQR